MAIVIEDDHMVSAIKALIGDETTAIQLASGSEEERKQILATMLPQE